MAKLKAFYLCLILSGLCLQSVSVASSITTDFVNENDQDFLAAVACKFPLSEPSKALEDFEIKKFVEACILHAEPTDADAWYAQLSSGVAEVGNYFYYSLWQVMGNQLPPAEAHVRSILRSQPDHSIRDLDHVAVNTSMRFIVMLKKDIFKRIQDTESSSTKARLEALFLKYAERTQFFAKVHFDHANTWVKSVMMEKNDWHEAIRGSKKHLFDAMNAEI